MVFAACTAGCSTSRASGNHVEVAKDKTGYHLMVNQKPFYIQGVGVGKAIGKNGENYLAMAKELGANAVRTWGADQGTQSYLDEARKQGLWVDAGIWINYADGKTVTYLDGSKYGQEKENEILDYVKRFKDHPAILSWNIGNECIFFTKDPEEREALCKFLDQLVQKVKKLDPNHPVIYASVNSLDLPYLKKYVPSIDIVGMNIYGSVIGSQSGWEALDFGKPYVVTEFGPLGPWDLPKDTFGKMVEQDDRSKSQQYRNHWSLIKERRGKNIGGFVFHIGETSQESMTMWNLNEGTNKKESFVVMQKFYGASNGKDHAPIIEALNGLPETIPAGKPVEIELKAKDPEGAPLTYEFRASTSTQDVLEYYVNVDVPIEVQGEGPKATLIAPSKAGIYRIYGFARDQTGHSATCSRTVKVE